MNQERFDDLTRALATKRISRGQVLKGLTAAVVGSVLGGSGNLLGAKKAKAQTVCPKDVPKACKKRGREEKIKFFTRCLNDCKNDPICLGGCKLLAEKIENDT